MRTSPAFLVHTDLYRWNPGKPLEILGVVFFAPEGLEPRACYRVRNPEDGEEDFTAIESTDYKLISAADVAAGNIPEATR